MCDVNNNSERLIQKFIEVQEAYTEARLKAQELNKKRRRVAKACADAGVSAYKVGEKAGMSHVSIYRLMTGKSR